MGRVRRMQLIINIVVSGCILALIAAGISVAQSATRQLPITFVSAMCIAAYVAHWSHSAGWSILIAGVVGALSGGATAWLLDLGLVRRLEANEQSMWKAVVVGLGAFMVCQSVIAVIFGEAGRTFIRFQDSIAIGDARITYLQLATVALAILAIGGTIIQLRVSRVGRGIVGLASNPGMCEILGLPVRAIRAYAVAIGGILVSVAAILDAANSGLVLNAAFTLFLSGATVTILAGIGSMGGVIGAAALLAVTRNLVAYLGNPIWVDAVTFLILVSFLVWKPIGIGGRRLRKVEV
jgi:branched-chain amino acid transport system permease protein